MSSINDVFWLISAGEIGYIRENSCFQYLSSCTLGQFLTRKLLEKQKIKKYFFKIFFERDLKNIFWNLDRASRPGRRDVFLKSSPKKCLKKIFFLCFLFLTYSSSKTGLVSNWKKSECHVFYTSTRSLRLDIGE